MSGQAKVQNIETDLTDALKSGLLSDSIAQRGRHILAQMQKPLRLSMLGLPSSGKSTLLNMLLGANVVPYDLTLPTLSFTYEELETVKCTLPNGEIETFETIDWKAISDLEAAFVEITAPLPSLRKLSMMELVTSKNLDDHQRAISWMSKRTDIALWCSQECTEVEQGIWDFLPEHLRDHAFLLITKSDDLRAKGVLKQQLTHAQDVGEDQFCHILPIDAKRSIQARQFDGTIDKDALKASGGIALISTILREVETGERAAKDAADVFLRQIEFDTTASNVPEISESEVTTAPKNPAPAPALKLTQVTAISPQARAICEQAIEQFIAEGKALEDQFRKGNVVSQTITDIGVETVIWLSEYLDENNIHGDPVMQRTCALANEAADLVQLIKLEKGDSVALDALSLMIQLKQEIKSELAA